MDSFVGDEVILELQRCVSLFELYLWERPLNFEQEMKCIFLYYPLQLPYVKQVSVEMTINHVTMP